MVPDRFLRIVCEEVINFGITADMAEHAYNFLRERKKGFMDILTKHKSEFTQITNWGIF